MIPFLMCHGRFNVPLQVFKVMQGLCEASNVLLQNYLNTQAENVTTYNLVLKTVQFLECVRDEYGVEQASNELIFQVLETLVEFVQGSPLNQRDIFDVHVIDSVNSIMRFVGLDSAFHANERAALIFPIVLQGLIVAA